VKVNVGIPESQITAPVLNAALEAVTTLNVQLIKSGQAPDFGALIRSGARWAPEPKGQESFDHAGVIAKRGWGDCFPQGTLLLRDDYQLVRIEEIQIGERIWSKDGWAVIKNKIEKGTLAVDTISLGNGAHVPLTSDHHVYLTTGARVRVSELTSGAELIRPAHQPVWKTGKIRTRADTNAFVVVREIQRSHFKAPCWDIQTSDGYVYLPEHDVTVSNCDDWAPAHAGSLRASGVDPQARAVVYKSGPNLWHAVTQRGDGRLQDPSQTAGMRVRPGSPTQGIPAAVVGAMSVAGVVGGDGQQPMIALAQVPAGYWVVRTDVPLQAGSTIVVKKSATNPARALSGCALGAAVLGGCSPHTDKADLDKLYALSGLLDGRTVEECASMVGSAAVKAALRTIAEICPQILAELRAHRRAVEKGATVTVGNIFDGYYTDPYGPGTPPEGRASDADVVDYGQYDRGWRETPPAPVEDRPAPPVLRRRPAPPVISGKHHHHGAKADAVRTAVQNMSPEERAALKAKLTAPSAPGGGGGDDDSDSDGSLAGDIAAVIGRHGHGHGHKHKGKRKHRHVQPPPQQDDGGGGGGGGDDGGGGGDDGGGGGDDGGGDDGGDDSTTSGSIYVWGDADPGTNAAASVLNWLRAHGLRAEGKMGRSPDGVFFNFAASFNRNLTNNVTGAPMAILATPTPAARALLVKLGYLPTFAGVQRYQNDTGLPATGIVDTATMTALKAGTVSGAMYRPAPPRTYRPAPPVRGYVPAIPPGPFQPAGPSIDAIRRARWEHEQRVMAESERLRARHAEVVARMVRESEALRMQHEDHIRRAHVEAERLREAHRRVA
jgi:Putative peptidoglycan binding domain